MIRSVLLIGVGRFGKNLAMRMSELKKQVMAIDTDEKRINDVLPYVTSRIIGDSTNEEFLKGLGVSNFDLCIVAIGNDFQSSLVTTSILKELGAKCVVSRATHDTQMKLLRKNGADDIIYPEYQSALWLANKYASDRILDYALLNNEFSMYEIGIPTSWEAMTVGQLNIRKRYMINIIAIRRDSVLNMDISSDTEFRSGDSVMVIGKWENIQKCFSLN